MPRCRLLKGTLHIEWLRQRTVQTLNPHTQRRYVFSDYLPKGRDCRYPDAVFQRVARDWELPLIQDYEARFADLRRRARALSQRRVQVRRRLLRPAAPAPLGPRCRPLSPPTVSWPSAMPPALACR